MTAVPPLQELGQVKEESPFGSSHSQHLAIRRERQSADLVTYPRPNETEK